MPNLPAGPVLILLDTIFDKMKPDGGYHRRDFIAMSLGVLGALAPVSKLKALEEVHAYEKDLFFPAPKKVAIISENGMFGYEGLFLLGMMLVSNGDENKLEQSFKALRQQHNYRTQLSAQSNDKYKLGFGAKVIDWFMEQNAALVIKLHPQTGRIKIKGNNASAYQVLQQKIDLYAQSFQAAGFDAERIVVKIQSTFGPGASFQNDFKARVKNVPFDAKYAKKDSEMLQVVNFLTGCVYWEAAGVTENTVKLMLSTRFKERMQITEFVPGNYAGGKLVIL